jgi:hypothetical protein
MLLCKKGGKKLGDAGVVKPRPTRLFAKGRERIVFKIVIWQKCEG